MSQRSAFVEGNTIGRYRLVRAIGSGAMGEVWHAVLEGPQGFARDVALKILKRDKQAEKYQETLAEEARLGARLSHPNVVGTHEFGMDEETGSFFLAMELVRGSSLAQLARHRPLQGQTLIDAMLQSLAGLAHVHELRRDADDQRLVHRDIKPSNLLLDRSGLVKVADLGVARWAGAQQRRSGTPGYMPMEQAKGKADHRSDLFALAVTMVRLGTNQRIFGTGRIGIAAVAESSIVAEASALPDILERSIPGVKDVLFRCLKTDPNDRYPDARAMAQALRRLLPKAMSGPSLLDLLRALPASASEEHEPEEPTVRTVSRIKPSQPAVEPGNLPMPTHPLVGHKRLLAHLKESTSPVQLIYGPAGTGKSHAALTFAHQRCERDGTLTGWRFDLAECTTEAEVEALVSKSLGVPLRGSSDALAHAIAARGKTLVLFDNAERCDALPSLLERWLPLTKDTRYLITTQKKITLPVKTSVYAIGRLTKDQAKLLFERRAARPIAANEEEDLVELLERIDRHPLAIELAAARTRVLSVHEIVSRLEASYRLLTDRSREQRHRSLEAAFQTSFGLLPAWAQSALSQLCACVGSFELDAADAILDLTGHTQAPYAMDVIGLLADHAMLRVEEDGRFRVIPLIRGLAQSRLPRDYRLGCRQHARYYAQLGSGGALDALTRRGGTRKRQRIRKEMENLMAVIRRATERRWADEAVGVGLALWGAMEFRGPYATATQMLRSLLDRYPTHPRAKETRVALARALRMQGKHHDAEQVLLPVAQSTSIEGCAARIVLAAVYLNLARFDEAKALIQQSVQEARANGNWALQGRALTRQGVIWYMTETEGAKEIWQEALQIQQARGNARSIGIVHGNLAAYYSRTGDYDAVRHHHKLLIENLRQARDRRGLAQAVRNHAVLQMAHNQLPEAIASLEEAIERNAQIGTVTAQGDCHALLSEALRRSGRPHEGLAQAERAMELLASSEMQRTAALSHLGLCQFSCKQLSKAATNLALALTAEESYGRTREVGTLCCWLARVYIERADLRRAEEASRKALTLLTTHDERQVFAFLTRAKVLLAMNDVAQAQRFWEDAQQVALLVDPLSDHIASELQQLQ